MTKRNIKPTNAPEIKVYVEYPSKSILLLYPVREKGRGIVGNIYRGVTISRMVAGGRTKEESTINVLISGCRVRDYYLETQCGETTLARAGERFPAIWSIVLKDALALLSQETGCTFTAKAA